MEQQRSSDLQIYFNIEVRVFEFSKDPHLLLVQNMDVL